MLITQKPIKPHFQSGFSLVELAIVLIVIGLIVAGVLKGQELIESARLKTILTQLNEFRLATSTFIERYDALPGDYNKAKEYIHPSLSNGNNDGMITGDGLDKASEAYQFWAHLTAAELIAKPGIPQNQGNEVSFGYGVPASRMGGGFTVAYTPQEDMPGHWFVLGKANGHKGNGALLTPLQAMSLDKKIDNGDPTSGRVRAANGVGGKANCIIEGRYNTASKEPACILYFQF